MIRGGNGPRGIGAAGSAIWFSSASDGTVSRIETGSDTVTVTLPVGKSPSAIAADGELVWVANKEDATLTKIDAEQAERIKTVSVGGTPTALTARAGSVWISVAASVGQRGGTLKLVGSAETFFGSAGAAALDPAVAYSLSGWMILTLTNDGLVEFKRVGGADGTTIVPNLAVALPTAGQDGRS